MRARGAFHVGDEEVGAQRSPQARYDYPLQTLAQLCARDGDGEVVKGRTADDGDGAVIKLSPLSAIGAARCFYP